MKNILGVALLVAFVIPHTLFPQATGFQIGKIVDIEKIHSASLPSGTEAPVSANYYEFNLTFRVNDQLYVCRAKTPELDLGWAQGKEVPVKVQGRTMAVKRAHGEIVELPILSTKRAD